MPASLKEFSQFGKLMKFLSFKWFEPILSEFPYFFYINGNVYLQFVISYYLFVPCIIMGTIQNLIELELWWSSRKCHLRLLRPNISTDLWKNSSIYDPNNWQSVHCRCLLELIYLFTSWSIYQLVFKHWSLYGLHSLALYSCKLMLWNLSLVPTN